MTDLENALMAARSRSEGGRLRRVIRSPYKMLSPVLMRRRGVTREISMPTFWNGTFLGLLPEAVSTLVWRTTYFDEAVCLTLLRTLKPGSVFVDIGAHFGFFSLLGSHLVGPNGRVISIEAMPSTFARLQKNIEHNSEHNNVTLYQGAAFDHATELEFHDFGVVASSLNSAFGSRGDNSLITKGNRSRAGCR